MIAVKIVRKSEVVKQCSYTCPYDIISSFTNSVVGRLNQYYAACNFSSGYIECCSLERETCSTLYLFHSNYNIQYRTLFPATHPILLWYTIQTDPMNSQLHASCNHLIACEQISYYLPRPHAFRFIAARLVNPEVNRSTSALSYATLSLSRCSCCRASSACSHATGSRCSILAAAASSLPASYSLLPPG